MVCQITGLLLVSTLVSSLPAHMTGMGAMKADEVASLSPVRRFLRQSQVRSR